MENPITLYKQRLIPGTWAWTELQQVVLILDNDRIPVNADEREVRISGKRQSDLFPYYGATGQVGWIDEFLFDDERVLLGEDGAPFLEALRDKAYLIKGKSWVNNHAHVLKSIDGLTINKYVMYYLNIFDYHGYVTGTTRYKLTQARMREIPFPLAPHAEQYRIVAKIEELFTQLDAAEAALKRAKANLERYRRSVLQAASSGQLVEQDPDDEPAEILLKRIEEHRRLQILDKRKTDFRAHLNLRIQTSSKVFSPQDVLVDLLLETILDDIQSKVVQQVIEVFFSIVDTATESDLLIKNYWTWLNTSFDHLRSFQYSSKVINAQIEAWDLWPEEGAHKERERQTHSAFTVGNFWSSTMLKGLDFQTIKLEGQSYLIEKFFNQPVEKEWKQILSQQRKPDLEKLPDLPEGWCWVTTDQLLDFVTSGSRGWARYYSDSGATFLRIGNLDHNTIDLDLRDLQKVSLPSTTEGMRTRVAENDILVSITADVGMIGLVPGDVGEAYINQHISLARPVELINAKYLAWFLASRL